MHLFLHPLINPFVLMSIFHPSVHLSVCLFICPSILPSICYSSLCPSVCTSVHLNVLVMKSSSLNYTTCDVHYRDVVLSFPPSVIHPSVHLLFIHLYIYPIIHLSSSTNSSVLTSIHPSVWGCIYIFSFSLTHLQEHLTDRFDFFFKYLVNFYNSLLLVQL